MRKKTIFTFVFIFVFIFVLPTVVFSQHRGPTNIERAICEGSGGFDRMFSHPELGVLMEQFDFRCSQWDNGDFAGRRTLVSTDLIIQDNIGWYVLAGSLAINTRQSVTLNSDFEEISSEYTDEMEYYSFRHVTRGGTRTLILDGVEFTYQD